MEIFKTVVIGLLKKQNSLPDYENSFENLKVYQEVIL